MPDVCFSRPRTPAPHECWLPQHLLQAAQSQGWQSEAAAVVLYCAGVAISRRLQTCSNGVDIDCNGAWFHEPSIMKKQLNHKIRSMAVKLTALVLCQLTFGGVIKLENSFQLS
ncbi:EF-hand calcium-binding domain protein [Apiospora arundinis]